jgi:hypothetical protein
MATNRDSVRVETFLAWLDLRSRNTTNDSGFVDRFVDDLGAVCVQIVNKSKMYCKSDRLRVVWKPMEYEKSRFPIQNHAF